MSFYDDQVVSCPACGQDRELQYDSTCPLCQNYHAQRNAQVVALLDQQRGDEQR